MKKIKYFGLMGAIALTSAIGFTACSSDDSATADVNPTYDGTSVRTDFAFNVTKASQDTRMSGTNTQESGNFLGMKDMYLLPFSEEPAAGKTTNYTSGSVRNYALGTLAGISATQSSKVYSLTFPVGTNNFLFYGFADNSNVTESFKKGEVTHSFQTDNPTEIGNTNAIHFDLKSIATSLDKDETTKDATNIAQYLTNIANATYKPDPNDASKNIKWEETVGKATTDGTYSAIALLYTKFTTNITQYAGSKEAVERLVFDLYKTAYAINGQSTVTNVSEIAKAICTAIENPNGTVKLSVKASDAEEAAAIKIANFSESTAATADKWVATLDGTHKDDNNKYFPAYLGLPMGAAQLTWNKTSKEFKYRLDAENKPSTNIGTETTALIADYRYPSEIIYFDNSPLRATNEYKKVSDYPVKTSDWDNLYQTETWPQTAVAADTRAVAMTNNVNYGVALLQTTVKVNDTGKMTDNMAAIIGGTATDQTITAAATKNIATKNSVFKVTGVLVGGQPSKVGWNMIPTSDANYNSVIYDNDVTFTDPLSTTSDNTKNYTVVFDNYYSPTQQNDVLIALEIVNDGCDFYGAEGLIPAGNTFYLLGKLQLSSATANKTIPTVNGGPRNNQSNSTYRITEEGKERVFVQDYKTIANLTLKADALKRAYSAIPDLRATEVLFGLSVDLNWEAGMKFDVEM